MSPEVHQHHSSLGDIILLTIILFAVLAVWDWSREQKRRGR